MQPFNPDSTESALFSKWHYTDYYTMLVSSTGLPNNTQFANANASQATYNIPQLPAAYQVTATRVPGLFYVWYGSPIRMTEKQVKADVSATIKRLRSASGILSSEDVKDPVFVEFRSHTPFKLSVGAKEIKDGFYDRLEKRKLTRYSRMKPFVVEVFTNTYDSARSSEYVVDWRGILVA